MTSEELMRRDAEKALREVDWDSIEYLFRPANGVELLLRIDLEGMRKKINDWIADDSPDAMPRRFRPPYTSQLLGAVKREEFYREMDSLRRASTAHQGADGSGQRRDDILREMFNS